MKEIWITSSDVGISQRAADGYLLDLTVGIRPRFSVAFWNLPRAPIRDWGQQGHLPCPRCCQSSHRAQAPHGPEDVVPSALALICSQTDFSGDLLGVRLIMYLQCRFLWKELCVSVAL